MALHFLFIYPDFWGAQDGVHKAAGTYHEGIASMSAVLKEDGHKISLYQITCMPTKEEFLTKVAGHNADMIGITIRSVPLESAVKIAGWLDDGFPEIPVVAGGYHPTLAPAETLSFRGIDAICIGEGEYPLRDMIRAYEKNGNRFNTFGESFWFKNDDGIRYFAFVDAILNMFEDWFYEFMELYKTRIGLKYSCNLRFDHMDEKMCRVLAETGCYYVTIGLENGNDAYRREFLKRSMSNEQILKVTHWLQKEGITVITQNIVGLPHETLALSLETVKLNARAGADRIIVNIFQPYPSTELGKISEEAGYIDSSIQLHPIAAVPLRMPDYPKRDILYALYAFGPLVKKYRRIYAIGDAETQARKEAALDRRITGKFYPRGVYRRAYQFKIRFVSHAKQTLANTMPVFYRKMRQRKYKLAE